MKRILFATDLSEVSNNAFEYLRAMTQDTNIIIDFINIVEIPYSYLSILPSERVEEIILSNKEKALKELEKLKMRLNKDMPSKLISHYGNFPSTEISRVASKINADLIVMGLRTKHTKLDRLMGSVTAHTMEKANVPVLAIPSGITYNGFENILFPTKIQEISNLNEEEKSIDWLLNFYKTFNGSTIQMVNVQKKEDVDIIYHDKPMKGITFKVHHASNIEKGIVECSEKNNINLIVLHKHEYGFLERLYHSNITRKLLFQSKIPLIVFT